MLHDTLRAATRQLHARLDEHKGLQRLLAPDLAAAEYAAILAAFWGFYTPLEASLARVAAGAAWAPWTTGRQQAERLARDLAHFGRRPEELPRCEHGPRIDSETEISGVLYVLEGSALGGQLISKRLTRSLALTPATGAAFFFGEGTGTRARWHDFLACLHVWAAPRNEAEIERSVAAARETFQALTLWLDRAEGVPG